MKKRFTYIICIFVLFCGIVSADTSLADVKELISKGKFEEAVSMCELLISSSGDSMSEILLEKGIALYYLWDKENALKVQFRQYPIEKAINTFRQAANCNILATADTAAKWVADCYFFALRYSEAISEYQAFEAAYPGSKYIAEVKHNKAKSYENIGNLKAAHAIYQEIVENYPEYRFIRTASFNMNRIEFLLEGVAE
ncbi:tetratricopeptide repeat protein [bacterium]|nr:tetratricopeptide repeat protein [bacterium]